MTDETVADGTSTAAVALRWAAGWSLAYVAAQTAGVAANGLLIAADAFGIASSNHRDLAIGDVLSDFVLPLTTGLLLFMAVPFTLALIVLWFSGRRRPPKGFRVMSLIVFLWMTPLMFLFWDLGWSFWTWLIAQLLIAVAIRPPRSDRYRTATS